MKRFSKIFVILLVFLTYSGALAQKYYDEQWKKVTANAKKGMVKSNLPLVLEIQKQAMKDQNVIQLIQSLKEEFRILNATDNDRNNNAVSSLFEKLQKTEQQLAGTDKLVFQVLLNHFFMEYYQEHSWEINGRTNISSQDISGIETWTRLDFKNYLAKSYQELDRQQPAMQKVPLDQYKQIFTYTNYLSYFPTLLDWYLIHKKDFFSESDFFTKNELEANRMGINTIFDQLIAQNTGNAKLYFMHQKLLDNCDFDRCKDITEQLEALLNSSVNGDYKAVIMGNIAEELLNKGKEKEALDYLRRAEAGYPKSPFAAEIKNAEERLLAPSLNLSYEQQVQSNRPVHVVAEYKNVSSFSITVYEVNDDITSFIQYARNPYGNIYGNIKKKLIRKEQYTLNDPKDFRQHKTSLEIRPLPSGFYVAEFSVDGVKDEKNIELENDNHRNFYFLVSDNKVIYRTKAEQNSASGNTMMLVNSENGRSLPGKNMVFYESAGNKTVTKTNVRTDGQGIFTFPDSENKDYYRFVLIRQPDTNDFQMMEIYGNSRPVTPITETKDTKQRKAQIFTDRAIYRPGQTVYFKVINTQRETESESVVPGLKQKITLTDANGQEVAVQTFTTNDFGSYHGSFILPKGKLNGSFYLQTDTHDGYRNISVEEYKRPKFEIVFDPVKEEYRYGQTIVLTGKALTFSGVPLSGATVKYEIRKSNIRWMYFSRYPQDQDDHENSILGEAKTDQQGMFTIKLDLKKNEKQEGIQVANYRIEASVTDINGETQTADTELKVSSVSHYIQADEIKDVFSGEPVKVKVETKNYSNQNLAKAYQVKLSRLQAPDRVFRSNFISEVQDRPVFSKQEFISKFPHDLYDRNDEPANYNVSAVILNGVSRKEESLELGKLEAGMYRLELYNMEGRDTIKTVQQFSVWNKNSLPAEQKTFLTVMPSEKEFVRGGKAVFHAYSSIPGALLNIFVQDGSGKTVTERREFRNGTLEYILYVPADKKANSLNIQFQVVAFNDVQTRSLNIPVKDADDESLRIETVTFRDKIEPGAAEKWSVKVSGKDKEKINAEVLANMYDLSLDKLAKNTFSWSRLYVPSSVIASYDIRNVLLTKYYQKMVPYYDRATVEAPYFSWFNGAADPGDGIMLETTTGMVSQEGVKAPAYSPPPPAPASARAKAVSRLTNVRVDDAAIDILQSGRQLSEMEKKELSDVDADGVLDKDDVLTNVQVRQNLNETAFFYPDLKTDADGNVHFEFTSPEALTRWKLMFLAHTKDARAATLEKEVVTQKEFSVTPNYPRFLREGDELNLQSKLSSLTDKKLNGSARLQILDAFTNEDLSAKFGLTELAAASGFNTDQAFSLSEKGNDVLTWKIKVPENVSSIIVKVTAKAGTYSDGEQQAVAVLPNRILVTDAVPVFVKEGETKTFELQNLKNAASGTLANVSNTLELTTNPIWDIIFALPGLKNDPNNSADVVFNKWFADVVASEIFRANPKVKNVFDEYQNKGLLKADLEKNQELKQVLLEETPWVLESNSEEEQMQKLALLFDTNTMTNSISQDWDELKKLQNPDGSFSWYPGYPGSYTTSVYILKNLGKINSWLKKDQDPQQQELVKNLIGYIDGEISRYTDSKGQNVWNNWTLDYLDARNYWEKTYPLKGKGAALKTSVIQKAKTAKIADFTFFGLHRMALLMNGYGLKDVSDKLMKYLKETSVETSDQGAYWKQNLNDWGWFGSKVVNQAGALEAFSQLKPDDAKFIEEMKIWLITQKEVNSWGSSRGTAEVIFTILNSGKSWTGAGSDKAVIIWGGKELKPEIQATGYIKSTVKSDMLNRNLAAVTVTKPGPGIIQGGLFWQYYENTGQIKSSETYVSVSKELYRKIKTVNGDELQKITSETPIKVGDRVTVRMILNTDRPMEFIQIKDMRAAGFEPVDVLSGYQWKNSLAWYQSVKDASTNFYIERMPKGKYVFEYDVVANASGKFSNGITTLQNYYAPQMNAHTKGENVVIYP
ncbi:alpha-2-macroglobulin family protein [uncultured Chryseobacterium sp.]|uniref:alpha-2-macroglobulin family protein n=1 Tax=uncultured Chryseobacterium sp. TaxID=259322 RepID=UPI0025FE6B23|nr:alpha-2-macroglobulin family protein [uncultured Chryseobacterium sp.]